MTLDLRSEPGRYGAGKDVVKLLDAKDDTTPLRYVDLFPESATRKVASVSSMPSGVLGYDDRRLMYLRPRNEAGRRGHEEAHCH